MEPLTPAQIERKIRECIHQLDETLATLGDATRERAEAQHAYDVAYLRAYEVQRHSEAKSSEKDRDNAAKLAAIDARRAQLLADGLVDVLRTRQAGLRDELSACQTLARFIADEATVYGRRN